MTKFYSVQLADRIVLQGIKRGLPNEEISQMILEYQQKIGWEYNPESDNFTKNVHINEKTLLVMSADSNQGKPIFEDDDIHISLHEIDEKGGEILLGCSRVAILSGVEEVSIEMIQRAFDDGKINNIENKYIIDLLG